MCTPFTRNPPLIGTCSFTMTFTPTRLNVVFGAGLLGNDSTVVAPILSESTVVEPVLT